MPIVTDGPMMAPERGIHELAASFGQSIGATASEAWADSPVSQLLTGLEIENAKGNRSYRPSEMDALGNALPTAVDLTEETRPAVPRMDMMEAIDRVKKAGLEKHLTLPNQPDIPPAQLEIMMRHARERAEREATIARGPQGFIPSALQVGTSFLVGAADPINLASAFVPVLGELRYGKMLAAAGDSLATRAVVRAGVGAAQGAVGQAALEPLDWWAHTQEGRDFGMSDVLHNIMFGAALGGGLHAAGGFAADVWRQRHQRPLFPYDLGEPLEYHTPWEELRSAMPATRPLIGEFPGLDAIYDTDRIAARAAAEQRAPYEPSPEVATIHDLPPRAHEDAMRVTIAALVNGEATRAGEMIESAAVTDPRVAESLEAQPRVAAVSAQAAGNAVFEDVHRQLTAAGFPEEEATANAQIVAARYAARAERLGGAAGTAFDLYRGEGLEVRRGEFEPAEGRIFNQPAIVSGVRINFPDKDHIALFDLGRRLADGEPVSEQEAEALFRRFHGFMIEDALHEQQLRHAEDLRDAARTYYDQVEEEMTKGRPFVAWDVIEPERREDWYRRALDEATTQVEPEHRRQLQLFQSRPTAPTFYSAVARAVDAAKQDKASPEQWLGMLRNAAGVKAEEMKWLGLEDWLKEQKGPVTKQEIADYVRANQIQVEEVKYGDTAPKEVVEHAIAAERAFMAYSEELAEKYDLNPNHNLAMYARLKYMGPAEVARYEELQREWKSASEAQGALQAKTRYASYRLPGGEDYRELLLTLPPSNFERPLPDGQTPFSERYNSSHWDEENVLAHVRFDDRISDGKRTLHLAEGQSDWHQAGKRKGYQTQEFKEEQRLARERYEEARAAVVERERQFWRDATGGKYESLGEARDGLDRTEFMYVRGEVNKRIDFDKELGRLLAERDEADHAIRDSRTAVPDAPFKTTWPELVMKRMIRWAAEHGYDRISWDTGATNAERYDLSKQISRINYQRVGKDRYAVDAYDHDGRRVLREDDVPIERVEGLVGKDIAKKIQDGSVEYRLWNSLEGLDLKVGGEGMVGFYDKILPATVNKLVKKFGAKVEETSIPVEVSREGAWRVDLPDGTSQRFQSEADAREWIARRGIRFGGPEKLHPVQDATKGVAAHAVDITPELRKAAVEQGFPLFQRQPMEPRRHGIPEAAGEIVSSHKDDKAIKAHADYKAAKAGDEHAALRLVQATVDPASIAQARERFGEGAIYAPIVAQEASGHNAIPHALAALYAYEAGGQVDDKLVQANRAYHTGAGPMERLAASVRFAGEVVQGGRYVIVDDVSVMGSTIAAMADHIQRNGGEVAGVVTLANASRTGVLRPPKAHIADIERRFGNDIRDLFGIEPSALTADEAHYVRNFRDADALRAAVASARRKREDRLAAKGFGGEEGLGQAGAEAPRGRITLAENSAIIDLFKAADQSTFMHEAGHLWLDELMRDAAHEAAPEQLRADQETVLRWLGVKDAGEIGVEHHEQWARGFEHYLATGEAPSNALARAFEQFKEWLSRIYQAITGTGQEISDEVRAVMGRMLATDREIAAQRALTSGMEGVETKAVRKAPRGRAAADPKTWSLFEYLASKGGLKPDPELWAIFGGKKGPMIGGFGPLLRKNGMALDEALRSAKDGHYMFDPADVTGAEGTLRPRDLLDLLDKENRKQKVYRLDHVQTDKAIDAEHEAKIIADALHDEIEAATGQKGVELDPAMVNRVVEIVQKEGEHDVLAAYERAIMEDHDRYEAEHLARIQDPETVLPGWDVPGDASPASEHGRAAAGERGQTGASEPGAGRADGGQPRAAGPGDRGPLSAELDRAAAWRSIAARRPDFDDPDVIAASNAAAKVEPPKTKLDERVTAAAKAEAYAKEMYDMFAHRLPEADRARLEELIAELDRKKADFDTVSQRGAACLFEGSAG